MSHPGRATPQIAAAEVGVWQAAAGDSEQPVGGVDPSNARTAFRSNLLNPSPASKPRRR
jgi:hypothetical protein